MMDFLVWQLEWEQYKFFNEEQLEGKFGARNQSNSSFYKEIVLIICNLYVHEHKK